MMRWIKLIQKEPIITIQTKICNIAAENRSLQEALNKNFEYTAPYTPQQYGKIERKFANFLW